MFSTKFSTKGIIRNNKICQFHHYQNLVDVTYNVFTYINEDGISYNNVLHFDPIIGYQIEWKVG